MPENHLDCHRDASSTTDQPAPGQVLAGQAPTAQVPPAQAPEVLAPSHPASPTGEASTDEQEPAFGEKTPSRFAADVEYSGSTGRHDYLVRVRHRLLDTTFTVVIDGIEHDPKAEMKARPPEENAGEDPGAASDGSDGPASGGSEAPAADPSESLATDEDSSRERGERAHAEPWADDDLRFTVKDGFATLLCTVRRPRDGGAYVDSEDITIRTVGLGDAGEVDIRHGFKRIVLVPADGSPSAAREEKRAAHPTRFALIAALTKSARYLVPLLGLGALFSGLLDPLLAWIEARVRPALDAIARMTEPVREWIAQLLRPIHEFLEAVFSPIREFFAALLRPVGDLLAWLLGLLPDIGLPFDIPDWLPDLLVPLIVVVSVFLATRKGLHSRGEKLAAAKAARGKEAASSVGPAHSAASPTEDDDTRPGAAADVHGAEDMAPHGDRSSTDPLRPQR